MSASALPFMPLLETKNQDEEAVADAGDNTTGPDEQSLQDSRCVCGDFLALVGVTFPVQTKLHFQHS